jgi:hypothetical protein
VTGNIIASTCIKPAFKHRVEVHGRAPDRASPNFMGLTRLGLEICIFCDFLYSVPLFNAILG